MTPARLQWGAALGDAPRRFWRRSAAVARRLPQTAAHNDERVPDVNAFNTQHLRSCDPSAWSPQTTSKGK